MSFEYVELARRTRVRDVERREGRVEGGVREGFMELRAQDMHDERVCSLL